MVLDSRQGVGGKSSPAYIFRPVAACPLQAHTGNVPNQFTFIQEEGCQFRPAGGSTRALIP